MRLENTIKNVKSTLLIYLINVFFQFVIRLVIIRYLSVEYLGLEGLFSNILSVLALSELGVGTAIVYSLYKPLAEKNIIVIKSIMQLFKRAYISIGLIIIVAGFLLTPYLNFFIKGESNIPFLEYYYLLFVLDSGVSYFFSYKRSLLIADQKQYITNWYRGICQLFVSVFQIIIIVFFNNFILYLIVRIFGTVIENFLIARRSEKDYDYLNDKDILPLDKEVKQDIVKNIKALILHKIGTVAVFSSSNIIISKYIGLIEVGIFSSYYLVLNSIIRIFGQIFNSLTASVGNLHVLESTEKKIDIFKKLEFITAWAAAILSVGLYTLINPLIELWLGKEYLFDNYIVVLMVINFYITYKRKSVQVFKDAMGLFWNNRYMPLGETIINLSLGIILAKLYGVAGVLIAMMVSSILMPCIVEPYITLKSKLKYKLFYYYREYLLYFILTIFICISNNIICSYFFDSVSILSFIIQGVISVVYCNIVWLICFFYKEEQRFLINLVYKKFLKLR